MEGPCGFCHFWRGEIKEHENWGKRATCKRFPQWIETNDNHHCGEFKNRLDSTTPEPGQ